MIQSGPLAIFVWRSGSFVYAADAGGGAMQRMKMFNSAACANDLALLERMINEWIESQGARIVQMTQSPFGSHLVICVVYTQGGEENGQHAEATVAVPEVFERTMEHAELDPDEGDTLLPEADLPY